MRLPRELTSFVGRQADLEQVFGALRSEALVTLVGVGGVGKTRLAVRAAAAVQTEFRYGAWLVDLASVSDPARVATAVAEALGVHERPGWDPLEALTASVRSTSCTTR